MKKIYIYITLHISYLQISYQLSSYIHRYLFLIYVSSEGK